MIASAVRAYTPMAEEKGITLTADLGEENIICGDDGKLRRVLRVLVENAIRHTDAGGTISVKLTDDGKTSCLTVTDTGEGIAPDALGHLFERFYQADSSRRKGGAGLGLAIAKWIVEAHGGTIGADSVL
jgi:signal transduction histidine kinase